MSDLFQPLRDDHAAVRPLPAEEVRRRGDLARRRRTALQAAAAACAVAVVTTVTFLGTGGGMSDRSDPGFLDPSPSQSSPSTVTMVPSPTASQRATTLPSAEPSVQPSRTPSSPPSPQQPSAPSTPPPARPLTALPADFQLEDGLPSGGQVEGPSDTVSGLSDLSYCEADPSPRDVSIDHLGATWQSEGLGVGRDIALYADGPTARAEAGQFVGYFQDCPRYTLDNGKTFVVTTVEALDGLGDRGWQVTRISEAGGRTQGISELLEIVQDGPTVLIQRTAVVDGPGAPENGTLQATSQAWLDPVVHRLTDLNALAAASQSYADVLGPTGFGPLELGMSRAEVEVQEGVELGRPAGGCTPMILDVGGDPVTGQITADGLVSLTTESTGVRTPAGIHPGSPVSELQEVYAHLVGTEEFTSAPATDDLSYGFTYAEGVITQISLRTVTAATCDDQHAG